MCPRCGLNQPCKKATDCASNRCVALGTSGRRLLNPRQLMSGLDDLPFKSGGLTALLNVCDVPTLLNYVDVFTGAGSEDMVETFLSNTEVVGALCANTQCPPTIASSIDRNKLPADVRAI